MPWICKIDFDYFFFSCYQNVIGQWASREYLHQLFSPVQAECAANAIAVVTLCLSPARCGGWKPAESIAQSAYEIFDVPFGR